LPLAARLAYSRAATPRRSGGSCAIQPALSLAHLPAFLRVTRRPSCPSASPARCR